jgi:hypothetical protein
LERRDFVVLISSQRQGADSDLSPKFTGFAALSWFLRGSKIEFHTASAFVVTS